MKLYVKRYIIAATAILIVVGCAAAGPMRNALIGAGGGALVWKAVANMVDVTSDNASGNDESVPRWIGTDATQIEETNVYVNGSDHVGVNTTSSSTIGARLHVRESGSAMLMPTNTVLAVQNNTADETNCFAAFSSGAQGKSVIYFGHPTDYDRGALWFDCATDDMKFWSTDDLKFEGDNVKITAASDGETSIDSALRLKRMTSTGGNYTVLAGDYYVGATTSGITVTLPSASTAGAGKTYVVKAQYLGVNTITVTSAGGNIDGSASVTLSGYRSIQVISDGSNWWTF